MARASSTSRPDRPEEDRDQRHRAAGPRPPGTGSRREPVGGSRARPGVRDPGSRAIRLASRERARDPDLQRPRRRARRLQRRSASLLMAQFDVFRNPGGGPFPLLLDVQAGILSDLATRVVVPLARRRTWKARSLTRLDPSVRLGRVEYVLVFQELAGIPCSELGDPVGTLRSRRDELVAALDLLFTPALQTGLADLLEPWHAEREETRRCPLFPGLHGRCSRASHPESPAALSFCGSGKRRIEGGMQLEGSPESDPRGQGRVARSRRGCPSGLGRPPWTGPCPCSWPHPAAARRFRPRSSGRGQPPLAVSTVLAGSSRPPTSSGTVSTISSP